MCSRELSELEWFSFGKCPRLAVVLDSAQKVRRKHALLFSKVFVRTPVEGALLYLFVFVLHVNDIFTGLHVGNSTIQYVNHF